MTDRNDKIVHMTDSREQVTAAQSAVVKSPKDSIPSHYSSSPRPPAIPDHIEVRHTLFTRGQLYDKYLNRRYSADMPTSLAPFFNKSVIRINDQGHVTLGKGYSESNGSRLLLAKAGMDQHDRLPPKERNQFLPAELARLEAALGPDPLGPKAVDAYADALAAARPEIVRRIGPIYKVLARVKAFEVRADYQTPSSFKEFVRVVSHAVSSEFGNPLFDDGEPTERKFISGEKVWVMYLRCPEGHRHPVEIKVYKKGDQVRLEVKYITFSEGEDVTLEPNYDRLRAYMLHLYWNADDLLARIHSKLDLPVPTLDLGELRRAILAYRVRGNGYDTRIDDFLGRIDQYGTYTPTRKKGNVPLGPTVLGKLSDPATGILERFEEPGKGGHRRKRYSYRLRPDWQQQYRRVSAQTVAV